MKNKKIILGLSVLSVGLLYAGMAVPSLAYRGDINQKSPSYSVERHETNIAAFEKGDYKLWLSQMNGKGVTRFVNEKNFKEFAEAQLAQNKGDSSKIQAFRAKYGMGQQKKDGSGFKAGNNR